MAMRNSALRLVPDVLLLPILSVLKTARFEVLTAMWLKKQLFLRCDIASLVEFVSSNITSKLSPSPFSQLLTFGADSVHFKFL